MLTALKRRSGFNTQPPEGGWQDQDTVFDDSELFQHTAARRRLALRKVFTRMMDTVSTHSRPKAAGARQAFDVGIALFQHTAARRRLAYPRRSKPTPKQFQHTAARRRLGDIKTLILNICGVSTHSRPKAAGQLRCSLLLSLTGFNTQPPEGGWIRMDPLLIIVVGFNTQPPEGGWVFPCITALSTAEFQHTAARRRLDQKQVIAELLIPVSTHSRPKAAGRQRHRLR